MGPYTQRVLAERRAHAAVHIVAEHEPADGGLTLADRTRQLYEQVGTLYRKMGAADTNGAGIEELGDFLDTARRALASPGGPSARAFAEALRRYERDRTGGAA